MNEKNLLEIIKKKTKKVELYYKCVNANICPSCGNDLILINTSEYKSKGFWDRGYNDIVFGRKCNNCNFDLTEKRKYYIGT